MSSTSLTKTLALSALAAVCACGSLRAEEAEDYARWYFSPGIGFYVTEGDQPLKDGLEADFRIGYDINEWWSLELGILWAPKLDEQFDKNLHREVPKGSGHWVTIPRPTSHSRGKDEYFDHTWMLEPYADLLFHFTRWERLDPYIAGGVGLNIYGKDVVKDGTSEFTFRVGPGLMYGLTDEWALRADWRVLLTSDNTEFNSIVDVGIVWHWGAGEEPALLAVDGPIDSDGDGLTDGDEVLVYKTDPLNPDSDYDLLKDGEEVKKYKTDPLDPDTDKGGVRDGHEVLEDGTNPLDGNDDFLRFELHLLFEYDKDIINQKDYPDLDKVAAVLLRHPEATAVIEGHADRTTRSKRPHNLDLSNRRANAVKQYLLRKGVDGSRLRAVGYGFDRPQYEPDMINGTPLNRRVEVYIKGVTDKNVSDTLKKLR